MESNMMILTPESGRDFMKGVKNLKRIGAKFDAASKTWSVSAEKWSSITATERGYIDVKRRPAPVQHDQACDAYYNATLPCECKEII